jgi:hypothetical protein
MSNQRRSTTNVSELPDQLKLQGKYAIFNLCKHHFEVKKEKKTFLPFQVIFLSSSLDLQYFYDATKMISRMLLQKQPFPLMDMRI